MGTRLMLGLIVAVLIGGGLVLAALVPGIGLIVLLGIVVLVVLAAMSFAAAGRSRGVPTQEADLLGSGGPDDPRARSTGSEAGPGVRLKKDIDLSAAVSVPHARRL